MGRRVSKQILLSYSLCKQGTRCAFSGARVGRRGSERWRDSADWASIRSVSVHNGTRTRMRRRHYNIIMPRPRTGIWETKLARKAMAVVKLVMNMARSARRKLHGATGGRATIDH